MSKAAPSVAQLRGKLAAATRRINDDRKSCYEHIGKMENESRDVMQARNSLAWLVLDAIAMLAPYDAPVLRLCKAGLEAKLDEYMPGFRLKIQIDRDRMAEGCAKADSAERERRAKKRAETGKPEDETDG